MVSFGKDTMKPTRLIGKCPFLPAIRKMALARQNIGIARMRCKASSGSAARLYKDSMGGAVGGDKKAPWELGGDVQ
eukprot:8982207-Pyramimonas_sp.AAC.1